MSRARRGRASEGARSKQPVSRQCPMPPGGRAGGGTGDAPRRSSSLCRVSHLNASRPLTEPRQRAMTLIRGMLTSIPVFRSVRVNPAKSQEPFQRGGRGGAGLKAFKGWGVGRRSSHRTGRNGICDSESVRSSALSLFEQTFPVVHFYILPLETSHPLL